MLRVPPSSTSSPAASPGPSPAAAGGGPAQGAADAILHMAAVHGGRWASIAPAPAPAPSPAPAPAPAFRSARAHPSLRRAVPIPLAIDLMASDIRSAEEIFLAAQQMAAAARAVSVHRDLVEALVAAIDRVTPWLAPTDEAARRRAGPQGEALSRAGLEALDGLTMVRLPALALAMLLPRMVSDNRGPDATGVALFGDRENRRLCADAVRLTAPARRQICGPGRRRPSAIARQAAARQVGCLLMRQLATGDATCDVRLCAAARRLLEVSQRPAGPTGRPDLAAVLQAALTFGAA